MARKKITNKKQPSREDKLRRLDNRFSEWAGNEVSIEHAYLQGYRIAREQVKVIK